MHLQVKIPQNGKNKVFTGKQTTRKVPLMLLDVKMLKKKVWAMFLGAEDKQATKAHVFSV